MLKDKLYLVDPRVVTLPHRITRPQQIRELSAEMKKGGWDTTQPALVGYWLDNKIQLLSGTHRGAAAKLSRTPIPVVIWTQEEIDAVWGTDNWTLIMDSGNPTPGGTIYD